MIATTKDVYCKRLRDVIAALAPHRAGRFNCIERLLLLLSVEGGKTNVFLQRRRAARRQTVTLLASPDYKLGALALIWVASSQADM